MDAPDTGRAINRKSPVVTLKLPGVTIAFTGLLSLIPVVALLALAVLLAFYLVRSATWSWLWVSVGLWILFIVYWTIAAAGAAPAKSAESTGSRQLHQLLMYGALALAFWRAPGLNGRWLPRGGYSVGIGLAVQISAGLLAVWARRHLGRNWSGAITAKVGHQLIRSGPYRRLRHPIYSGMLGMFLGVAIVSGELHGLLAMAIIGVAYWRKIRIEERNLETIFGDAYDEYKRESWALIPWVI